MRYVIIADLHCREVWKQIVEKESDSDKFIFLGDYTCPRDVKLDDPTDACGFLYEVLDFKDQNPDKVILLRGNHDDCSLGYHWAECYPQDDLKVQAYWQTNDIKNWFLSNTQWIYRIPDTNIICSHAGISEKFLDNVCKYFKYHKDGWDFNVYDQNQLISHINDIEPCELFGFTSSNPFDTNGESPCQPCTWIRPSTLVECSPENIIQVVGHTPVAKGILHWNNLWLCDALGLERPEYLVIEDGEFNICKV